jgi:3-phosphoshikimate 1-carboxyvinyltransferase
VTQLEGTREFVVQGQGGLIPVKSARLQLGNAGTAFRPLTAALALSGGHYELSGVPRMHERPSAISSMRCVSSVPTSVISATRVIRRSDRPLAAPRLGGPGPVGAPVRCSRHGSWRRVESVHVRAADGVAARRGARQPPDARRHRRRAHLEAVRRDHHPSHGALRSRRRAGRLALVSHSGWRALLEPGHLHVEGDASSASYFLAAGAIGGGPVRVTGVGRDSIQGDAAFADVLERMGARIDRGDNWIEARSGSTLAGIEIDCTPIPDAAMTLASSPCSRRVRRRSPASPAGG